MTKTPKCHIVDTRLAAHVLKVNASKLNQFVAPERGALVESFIFNELKKQSTWAENPVDFYHYRDRNQSEIDIIIEHDDGRIIAVEIKGSSTIEDIKHLKSLQAKYLETFNHGYLMYLGKEALPLGPSITALPFGALWE